MRPLQLLALGTVHVAWMLCSSCAFYHGGSQYQAKTQAPVVAKLEAKGCEFPSGLPDLALDKASLMMAQGTEDFSILVLDPSGSGIEVDNHWLEKGDHLFAFSKRQEG